MRAFLIALVLIALVIVAGTVARRAIEQQRHDAEEFAKCQQTPGCVWQ